MITYSPLPLGALKSSQISQAVSVERKKMFHEVWSRTNQNNANRFKISIWLGFCWCSLKQTQNEVNSDHNHKLLKIGVCNCQKIEFHPKAISNTNHNSRNKKFVLESK
jgi:hypothetical protein